MGKKTVVFFGVIVLLGTGIVFGLRLFMKNRVEEELTARVAQNSTVESLDYESLNSGWIGSWFSLKNVSLKIAGIDEPIRMREIRVPDYRLENDLLTELHLEIEDLVVSQGICVSGGAESRESPEDLKADASLVYRFDPGSNDLELESLKIISPEWGYAVLNLSLTNIEPNRISMDDPASSVPALLGVSIAAADLVYEDRSALKRLLRTGGNRPTPLLEALSSQISSEIARLEQTEGSKRALASLRKLKIYLQNPERIHITANPYKPVPLGRFIWVRQPGDFFDILNIRVEI